MSAPPARTVDYAPAPPGWYPDPASEGGRRFWDGRSWRQETAASCAPAAPPSGIETITAPADLAEATAPLLERLVRLARPKRRAR